MAKNSIFDIQSMDPVLGEVANMPLSEKIKKIDAKNYVLSGVVSVTELLALEAEICRGLEPGQKIVDRIPILGVGEIKASDLRDLRLHDAPNYGGMIPSEVNTPRKGEVIPVKVQITDYHVIIG